MSLGSKAKNVYVERFCEEQVDKSETVTKSTTERFFFTSLEQSYSEFLLEIANLEERKSHKCLSCFRYCNLG